MGGSRLRHWLVAQVESGGEERIQHTNRIRGLLSRQGVRDYDPLRRDRFERLEALRTGDGRELPPMLKAEIRRELAP